jgi:hypothetical protein
MPPKPGDRIVLDAQMLADYLLGAVRPTQRSQVAEILLASCCIALYSTKLRQELEGAVRKRGLPVPDQSIVRFLAQHNRKLVHVPKSKLEATPVHTAIAKHVNAKDQHVAHLAVVGAARWLITDDVRFSDECATRAVAELFTAVTPAQVLQSPPIPGRC